MIDSKGIDERIGRLESVARSLAEDARGAQGQPEYVSLLYDAIAGVDAAKAVLERVRERLRREGRVSG